MSRKDFPRSKHPKTGDWVFDVMVRFPQGHLGARWVHRTGIMVLSSVDDVRDRGPEFHMSVTYRGGVASAEHVRVALEAFDMAGSDEDNHVPNGRVRNFWLPVNRDVGLCECKDEKLHERGEYAWRDAP